MNHERLGTLPELARRCMATWDGEPGLPTATLFDALLEATFFASMHEEEARRTEYDVAWQPHAHGCTTVIAIHPPMRATPKNLAKLAPATHQDGTAIAVRADEHGELVVWALLERGKANHQPLTIRVLGAGVLRIDHRGKAVALYARGEIFVASAIRSPAQLLARTFTGWGSDEAATIITTIAARCLAHDHGGMILVIPAALPEPVGVRIHYRVGDGASLLVDRVSNHERIDRTVDAIARLTAVDNALLIDTDLRVRGFGTQVLEGDTPPLTFAHLDPYSTEEHVDDLATFKGTRHPAGVIFCMRQAGEAAAIIASQDGRLSLVLANGCDGVKVIGPYERGFGWSA